MLPVVTMSPRATEVVHAEGKSDVWHRKVQLCACSVARMCA